jgi:uncharacterized protein (DUF427 family)
MANIPEHLRVEVNKWRNMERKRPNDIKIPDPGQESVWDYPRPPKVEHIGKHLRVEFGGIAIAESNHTIRIIETASPPVYYFPPDSVLMKYIEPSQRRSLCEWKGRAIYYSVRVGKQFSENATWSYPDPWEGYQAILGYLAFYAAKMDACYIDGQQVKPQPGEFYGGWITVDILGPFKGEQGTEEW